MSVARARIAEPRSDPTEHPAYRAFAEVVESVIAPRAVEVDATEVPRSHLDALAEVGYLRWAVPEEHGGLSVPDAVKNAADNLLFGADPSTATVVTQHGGPVGQALEAGTPEALALLPELATGRRIGGAGFGHVRSWPAKRGTIATRTAGGWYFNGVVGWISGLGLIDTAWLGAVDEQQEAYVFGIGDLRRAGVTTIPLRLAAVQGSRTGSLRLENLFIPDAYVSRIVPVAEWKAADGVVPPDPRRHSGHRPGGPLPPVGALGLARAALRDALELRPGEPSLLALREELETAARTPLPDQQWRAVLDELAVRATTAAVVARGGSALLLDDIAQVRARAAQFLQVRSIGPVVRTAHLAQYARIATDRQSLPSKGILMTDQAATDQTATDQTEIVPLVTPQTAHEAVDRGALLIDVRSQAGRDKDGGLPEATLVDRTRVAELFGFDSPGRLPVAVDADQEIVVVCGSINGSRPVAEELSRLGYRNVTQVDGGFPAWRDAGLPVTEPGAANG